MNVATTPSAAREAAASFSAPTFAGTDRADATVRTAGLLPLKGGRPISTNVLGAAMTECFGGTDAESPCARATLRPFCYLRHQGKIEGAIASGSNERGLAAITAESIVVAASTQHNVSEREVS